VVFTNARRWTLTVALGKDGSWSVRSPELGLELPARPPATDAAKPQLDAASKKTVLKVGEGIGAARLGASTRDDVGLVLGEALEDVAMPTGSRNVSYRGGITCNFTPDGKLNTILTRASFAGRTSNGIAHGMSRAEVKRRLGVPSGERDDAPTWTYPGLLVTFDATGAVIRLVLSRT
jgi:hypothetical protein